MQNLRPSVHYLLYVGHNHYCLKKTVGGEAYTFTKTGETSEYGCMDAFIYSKDGMPGSLFCFMAGILEYECLEDGEMISFILNFISSTGNQHNVDLLATHLKFQICNCDIPYIFQADSSGMFHFACVTEMHCPRWRNGSNDYSDDLLKIKNKLFTMTAKIIFVPY